jgi:hypothetical protein
MGRAREEWLKERQEGIGGGSRKRWGGYSGDELVYEQCGAVGVARRAEGQSIYGGGEEYAGWKRKVR